MESEEILSTRYAQGLFEVAKQENRLEEVMKYLQLLTESFYKDKDFYKILTHPLISREEKKSIFNEILQKFRITYPLESFIYLLIDERRENLLDGIFSSFRQFYRREKHCLHVYIETADEISSPERQMLYEALQKKFKRQIEIELSVRPDILGGIYIRLQNTVYDDTVKRKLAMLKESIIWK